MYHTSDQHNYPTPIPTRLVFNRRRKAECKGFTRAVIRQASSPGKLSVQKLKIRGVQCKVSSFDL